MDKTNMTSIETQARQNAEAAKRFFSEIPNLRHAKIEISSKNGVAETIEYRFLRVSATTLEEKPSVSYRVLFNEDLD